MVRRARNLWLGFCGLVLISAIATAGAADLVGQPAPGLVVAALDGSVLDLATLRGKVVVLNLWATWCSPCRAELPMLSAYARKHQDDALVVLGLSADDPHDRRDVEKIARGIGYPVALLQQARINGFGAPQVLPVTYVIDAQGVVRERLLPTRAGLSEAALATVVDPLLAATHASAGP